MIQCKSWSLIIWNLTNKKVVIISDAIACSRLQTKNTRESMYSDILFTIYTIYKLNRKTIYQYSNHVSHIVLYLIIHTHKAFLPLAFENYFAVFRYGFMVSLYLIDYIEEASVRTSSFDNKWTLLRNLFEYNRE